MKSGLHANPLLELYAAGRCADCPRAERWLARLAAERPGIVALLWHTDEADYLPGRPPARGGARLTPRQRIALEQRPLVLLQGRESPRWGSEAFLQDLAHVARQPARVRLGLRAGPADGALSIEAGVEFLDEAVREVLLYVAAYARTPGESRLAHAWEGPVVLSRALPRVTRRVPLVPGKRPDQSGLAAFVQDRRSGEVLQALTLPSCPG